MMKHLIFFILIFFCGCDQKKKDDFIEDAFNLTKKDLSLFRGNSIEQGNSCLIGIKTIYGGEGIFSGTPTVDEITKKFGEASLYKLVSFCKTNNIYSFRSIGNGFLIKTNNCYFTFDELKKRDGEFYDNTLNKMQLSNDEIKNSKPGLCFFIGHNDSIIDVLAKDRKIYSLNDSVFYFWKRTPKILLGCTTGLIR